VWKSHQHRCELDLNLQQGSLQQSTLITAPPKQPVLHVEILSKIINTLKKQKLLMLLSAVVLKNCKQKYLPPRQLTIFYRWIVRVNKLIFNELDGDWWLSWKIRDHLFVTEQNKFIIYVVSQNGLSANLQQPTINKILIYFYFYYYYYHRKAVLTKQTLEHDR